MVPQAGFKVDLLPGRGIQRRLTPATISAVVDLARAFARGLVIVRKRRPAVVVVLGGYASAACGVGAVLCRVPIVLLEQNKKAGAVNRLLRRVARASAVSFAGTDLPRSVVTGNPLRPEIRAMAQKAVDEYLTRVSEDTLLREEETTDLRKLRQDLLRSALPFYQNFVSQNERDPALRGQLADAHFRLGSITEVIGPTSDALKHYQSAVSQLEELVGSDPESIPFRTRLADCYFAIGRVERDQDHRDSLRRLTAALEIYESLSSEKPDDPGLKASLANCYSELGMVHSYDQQFQKALDALNRSRRFLDELVARDPRNIDLRKNLAEVVNRMGFVDYKQGNYTAALRLYQEFQQLCLEILSELQLVRKPLRIMEPLARSYYNIGAMRLERSEIAEAIEAYREAEKTYRSLVADHSSVTLYKQYLGETYISIATAQYRIRKISEALASISQARTLFERFLADEPDNLVYLSDMSLIEDVEGACHDFERHPKLAEPPFKESLRLRRKLVEKSQDKDEALSSLCLSLTNLGECHVDEGNLGESLPLYREALRHRAELLSDQPGSIERATDLAELALPVAEIELQGGDPKAALAICLEARTAVENCLKSHPTDASLEALRARILIEDAEIQLQASAGEEAVDALRQAVEVNRSLLNAAPGNPTPRKALTEALWELAEAERGQGRPEVASRLENDRLSLWKDQKLEPLLELASRQAARGRIVGYGMTPLSAAGETVRRHGLERALASLVLAVQLGFEDLAKISSDPDLAPLLERDELKSFLAGHRPRAVEHRP